jgi:tetratricopeptide (TPR) repeat protein
MTLARAAAQRAIELDPTVPEAYAALAYALANEGRFAETEPLFRTALELNPSYAVAMLWHSQVLGTRGRLDLALEEGRRAAELDPLAFIIIDRLAEMLRHAGQDEEALLVSRRAAALRSDEFLPNTGEQTVLLTQLGRLEEAVKLARAIRRNPSDRTRWMADGQAIWVLQKAGLHEEALAHASEFSARPCGQGYARGYVLAALGHHDEALAYLEKSPPIAYRRIYFDHLFEPLRDDPRFAQLIHKLGCTAEFKLARETLALITQGRPEKK